MLLFGFALAGPFGPSAPVFAQTSGDTEGTQEGDDLEQLEAREDETLNSLFDDLRRQTRIIGRQPHFTQDLDRMGKIRVPTVLIC